MNTYRAILFSVDSGIATITLNRPESLNSYNEDLQNDLLSAFDRVDAEDSIRAVVVTGAGRAFCAGADLSGGGSAFEFECADEGSEGGARDESGSHRPRAPRDGGGLVTLRIFRCLKPVIGAVNGPAIGVGATMLLPMDIRICADTARFGFVFARRGIVPECASSWFLPRVVGISRALEWCMSGRIISAADAYAANLVGSLHPAEDLLSAARGVAQDLVAHSAPVSVALVRQMMWRGLTLDHPMEAHRVDSRLLYERARSADVREGVESFLQKREPLFTDQVSRDMPPTYPWWAEPSFE